MKFTPLPIRQKGEFLVRCLIVGNRFKVFFALVNRLVSYDIQDIFMTTRLMQCFSFLRRVDKKDAYFKHSKNEIS